MAFVNTAFVGCCFAYGVGFTWWNMKPAPVVVAIVLYMARLLMGWATQLPLHPEYFSSALDFPDIIHGNTVIHSIPSTNCVCESVMAWVLCS